jgi:hypothetical protein
LKYQFFFSRLLLCSEDYEKTYDNVMNRLMVRPWDNWRGINPSGVGDFNPDPPIFAAKFANNENYNHILAIANEDGRVSYFNC